MGEFLSVALRGVVTSDHNGVEIEAPPLSHFEEHHCCRFLRVQPALIQQCFPGRERDAHIMA